VSEHPGNATTRLAWAPNGARLRAALRVLAEAENEVERAIVIEREAGTSWAAIGDVLGVSRQAAWQRYAHLAF
jgi:hypothetical protein